jgi:hypothetical protein
MKKINQTPMYISVQLENTDYNRKMLLDLPVSRVQFADALYRLGCNNGNVRIVGYSTFGTALMCDALMDSPLSVVNYLAARLRELTPDEILKLRAIVESEHYFSKAEQVLDFTFNTDRYTLLQGITDEEQLGWYYLGSPGFDFSSPGNEPVSRYEYGAKLADIECGAFVPQGYITSKLRWHIPDERHPVPGFLNLHGFLSTDVRGDSYKEADFDYGD